MSSESYSYYLLELALVQLFRPLRWSGKDTPDTTGGGVESREISPIIKLQEALTRQGVGHLDEWKSFSLGPTIRRLIEGEIPSDPSMPSESARYLRPREWMKFVQELKETLWNETSDFVSRLQELYQALGVDWDEEERAGYELKLVWLSLQDKIIKTLKVATCLAFTEHFGTQPPELKGLPGLSFFSYRFRQMLNVWKSPKRKSKIVNTWRVYTVFQGFKKALLPVRPEQILDSLVGHRAGLTSDPSFTGDMGRVEMIAYRLQQRLGRLDYSGRIQSVSAKSTMESNMAQRGQIGLAVRALDHANGLSYFLHRTVPQFLGFTTCLSPKPIYGQVVDLSEMADQLYEFSPDCKTSYGATPALVLEPMKCRIITKPGAGDYVPLNCIQKVLWRRLQSAFPCFPLIGRPLCADDLNSRFAYLGESPQNCQWGFCSGDFSSATDLLKGDVSRKLVEVLFQGIKWSDPLIYDRIERTLFSTTIHWEQTNLPRMEECPWMKFNVWRHAGKEPCHLSKSDLRDEIDSTTSWMLTSRGLESGLQRNGQLMGHVLSFPLLCLANLTAYLYAWETYHGIPRGKFPEYLLDRLLINGDDILFADTEDFYQHWLRTVPLFGLIPSVGKNLFSNKVAQINSELYILRRTPADDYYTILNGFENSHFEKCNYLNFGLMHGRGKGRAGGTHQSRVERVSGFWETSWFTKDGSVEEVPQIVRMLKTLPQIRESVYTETPAGLKSVVSELFEQNFIRPFAREFSSLPWGMVLEEDWTRTNEKGVALSSYLSDVFNRLTVAPIHEDKAYRLDTFVKYLPDQEDPEEYVKMMRRSLSRKSKLLLHDPTKYWERKFGRYDGVEQEKSEPVFRDTRYTWMNSRRSSSGISTLGRETLFAGHLGCSEHCTGCRLLNPLNWTGHPV